MPSADDLASFDRKRLTGIAAASSIIREMPKLPDDVKKRFPSLQQWELEVEAWRVEVNIALRAGQS